MAIINWFTGSRWIKIPPTGKRFRISADSPELSEIYGNQWLHYFNDNKLSLGLEGYYIASQDRLEIHRYDSATNTAYTEWEDWRDMEVLGYTSLSNQWQSLLGKGLDLEDDYFEQSLDSEFLNPDEYIEQIMSHLGDMVDREGWSIHNWKISDFEWIDDDYGEESFTVTAGDGSSHTYTGDGEQKALNWSLKTDMSQWQIVKL